MDKIKVLIANDIVVNKGYYRNQLLKETDMDIVGEVFSGEDVIKKAKLVLPNVVILDLNMSMMNSIAATEKITVNNPEVTVIIVSSHSDVDYMKRAMLAGARDYLIKPFEEDELAQSVRQAYRIGKQYVENIESNKSGKERALNTPQIVTIFGNKGGVGKTLLSVNLAVQIAQKTGKKVALVDLDLQFGDAAVFLNILPKRSISELVQENNRKNIETIETYLVEHVSGVKLLPAPMRPEYSELVEAEYVSELLSLLRQYYDYVIIDTPPYLNDSVLSDLEISNQILLIMSMDMASIKNSKLSLDLLDSLHHKGKTKLILNRASEEFGIKPEDVEESLEFLITEQIPSDGKLAVRSINRGIPFVINKPNAKISMCIDNIAKLVMKDMGYQKDLKEYRRKGTIFRKLFG